MGMYPPFVIRQHRLCSRLYAFHGDKGQLLRGSNDTIHLSTRVHRARGEVAGDFRWFGRILVGYRSCFLRRVLDRIMLRERLKFFMTNELDDGF